MFTKHNSKRWLWKLTAVLFLGILGIAGQVGAAGLFCRSDPVIVLSNGVIIDTGATVSTLPWNVEEVHYELHAPAGVNLVVAIPTPTWISTYETFTYIADQPPGKYSIVAVVHTSTGEETVVLDALLLYPNLFNLRLNRYTAPGVEGQWLRINWSL
jgi:hypothetical protein